MTSSSSPIRRQLLPEGRIAVGGRHPFMYRMLDGEHPDNMVELKRRRPFNF